MADSHSNRKVLRVAIVGCGRQGKVHAENFAFACPNAELVGIVDPNPAAHEWARQRIGPDLCFEKDIQGLYRRFKIQSGAKPGAHGLDALVIASSTDSHASLTASAVEHGLHVLLEKPVAIDLPSHNIVMEAANKRPDVKIVIALSRRFDPSYRQGIERANKGDMGEVYAIKSATVDLHDASGWFIPYSQKSGGIWIDCGIHDIDIARWFLGLSDANSKAKISHVYSIGFNALHPELGQYGDVDNTYGLIQLTDGRSCSINLGRTAIHGHECSAEIHGTRGRLVVNQNPVNNRNTIQDQYGVRSLSTPSYLERFQDAFVIEAKEFVNHCLYSTPVPVTLQDAVAAAQIATGLTYALRSGQIVRFKDTGDPIKPESLEPSQVRSDGWARGVSIGGGQGMQMAARSKL
ncbi:unnamed protein product [Sympodiomycopsis kandeliae]